MGWGRAPPTTSPKPEPSTSLLACNPSPSITRLSPTSAQPSYNTASFLLPQEVLFLVSIMDLRPLDCYLFGRAGACPDVDTLSCLPRVNVTITTSAGGAGVTFTPDVAERTVRAGTTASAACSASSSTPLAIAVRLDNCERQHAALSAQSISFRPAVVQA
ncbi:hypothetical protein CALVIDRAFT_332307 [Calocera viscosa TUFC12733]|uniref:Uncharacterized protein n=1 Tax=Calocera viscosa (strain TUFC12733) TaxID=1330018 RepID=A0A167HP05_CALVF|nr:hypothetical protein CALVIDRAFT_332307 [Calocera viscosa TUFC12733]